MLQQSLKHPRNRLACLECPILGFGSAKEQFTQLNTFSKSTGFLLSFLSKIDLNLTPIQDSKWTCTQTLGPQSAVQHGHTTDQG